MPNINSFLEGATKILVKIASEIGAALEDTHFDSSISAGLKGLPQTLKEYPKAWIKAQGITAKALAKDSKYIKIHSMHADPKIAELGKAIEEMLEVPFVKRFRRNKIHVFISPENALFDKEMLESKMGGIFKVHQAASHSPIAAGIKTILIPAEHFEKLSVDELKVIVGHEIGHNLRADVHVRRGFEMYNRRTQDAEKFADLAGIVMSGEPKALQSALDKIVDTQRTKIEALPDNSYFTRKAKKSMKGYTPDKSTRIYPSMNERKKMAEQVGVMLETPEGRSHVEAEITRRLEVEHRKLFPHHYDRPIGNTRE